MDKKIWYQDPLIRFIDDDDLMSIPYIFDSGIYENYGKYNSVSWCINCLDFVVRVLKNKLCLLDYEDMSLCDLLKDLLSEANKYIEDADEVFARVKIRSSFAGWGVVQLMATDHLINIIERNVTKNDEGEVEHVSGNFMKEISRQFDIYNVGFGCGSFFSFENQSFFIKEEFRRLLED